MEAHEAEQLPKDLFQRDLVSAVRCWLIVVPRDGILQFKHGPAESAGETATTWRDVIRESLAKIRPIQEFAWTALIGTDTFVSHNRAQRLNAPTTILDMQLEASNTELREYRETRIPPDLFSRTHVSSWPVVVRGRSTGRDWSNADEDAWSELQNLCVLTSVGWGSCWSVRVPPRVYSGVFEVPTSSPFDKTPQEEEADETPMAHDVVEPLTWFEEGLTRLRTDVSVRDAAGMYHEGLRLQHNHPTLSMVAMVSAVETIAEVMFGPAERCASCGAHKGMAKRFRDALKTMMSKSEVRDLQKLYDRHRSPSVHAGALHGNERTASRVLGFDIFKTPDSRWEFTIALWQLAKATRKLLITHLGGDPAIADLPSFT